jgi:hypothetical protein
MGHTQTAISHANCNLDDFPDARPTAVSLGFHDGGLTSQLFPRLMGIELLEIRKVSTHRAGFGNGFDVAGLTNLAETTSAVDGHGVPLVALLTIPSAIVLCQRTYDSSRRALIDR